MVPINIRSFPRPAPDQTPSKYFFGTSVDGPASDPPVSAELPVSAHSSASFTDYEGSGGIRLSGMSAEFRGSANRCAPLEGRAGLSWVVSLQWRGQSPMTIGGNTLPKQPCNEVDNDLAAWQPAIGS